MTPSDLASLGHLPRKPGEDEHGWTTENGRCPPSRPRDPGALWSGSEAEPKRSEVLDPKVSEANDPGPKGRR